MPRIYILLDSPISTGLPHGMETALQNHLLFLALLQHISTIMLSWPSGDAGLDLWTSLCCGRMPPCTLGTRVVSERLLLKYSKISEKHITLQELRYWWVRSETDNGRLLLNLTQLFAALNLENMFETTIWTEETLIGKTTLQWRLVQVSSG